MHHHINYIEFAAGDLDEFERFYSSVFGWTFQKWGKDYRSFAAAGLEGGVRAEPATEGSTLVILHSDDLKASENAVVAAGGKITARHEFPGGRRFHFQDTTGNSLAVWSKG